MEVKIVNKSNNEMPHYATVGSAGMDIRADLSKSESKVITLGPMGRAIVPTGLYMELSLGYECQIRPRSGLAAKKGISVLNTPGTIDSDYRGEVGVIIVNLSPETVQINDGDRIAQMVFARHEVAELNEVYVLSDTDRGAGGFGHTGVK